MTEENNQAESVRKTFEEALNQQGYGFHHSVLKKSHDLSKAGKSKWAFESAEFPVEVRGKDTRIDFVLRLWRNQENDPNVYLIAECKRVNPAYGTWCFARTPYFNRERNEELYIIERLKRTASKHSDYVNTRTHINKYNIKNNIYNIALEVKANKVGDNNLQGTPGKAIEDAAAQVLKGFNGFIDFMANHTNMLGNVQEESGGFRTAVTASFLPVIFTTAELWTTNIDVSTANIEDGKLQLTKESLTKQSWIGYQYHQSPGLKHSIVSQEQLKSLGEVMDAEYVRTIPIVTPSGIEEFLVWSSKISNW